LGKTAVYFAGWRENKGHISELGAAKSISEHGCLLVHGCSFSRIAFPGMWICCFSCCSLGGWLDDKTPTVWARIGEIFAHEPECPSLTLFWWCLRVLASTHPLVLDVIFYPCWTIHFGIYWLGHLAKIKILTLEAGLRCWCWPFHQLPRQHLKLSIEVWKKASLQVECLLNVDEARVIEFNLRSLSVDLIGSYMANCFCFIFHLRLNFRRSCKAVGIPCNCG
jgi:hypothetical protein